MRRLLVMFLILWFAALFYWLHRYGGSTGVWFLFYPSIILGLAVCIEWERLK